MLAAFGHPLFHRLRHRRGTALAQYDKPYAPTVPRVRFRRDLHKCIGPVRGEGDGQRPYPGDRQCTGEGQCEHGHLGAEGTGGGVGGTPSEGAGHQRNGQGRTAPQEQE